MEYTKNYRLKKPQDNETAEIQDIRDNMDLIDAILFTMLTKALKGAAGGVAELGSDGKVPKIQLPPMNFDPAGSAASVQTNLNSHTNNKSNPHGTTAAQVTQDANNRFVTDAEKSAWNGKASATHTHDERYCKIATGSYVGTGTAGNGNKNSLTFPFSPKSIFIYSNNDNYITVGLLSPVGGAALHSASSSSGFGNGRAIFCAVSGNSVFWYSTADHYQLNTNGQTYNYVALG